MTPEQLKHLERCTRGESHPSAKLTAEDVLEIRKAELRRSRYAKRYGVCVRTIAHIQNRTSWAWLLPDGSIDITLKSGEHNDSRKSRPRRQRDTVAETGASPATTGELADQLP